MEDLKLRNFDILDNVESRTPCRRCGDVSRKYFCYTCCTPMPALIDRLPRIRLPINIDIVRHPKEKHGKSTGVHCAILAPDNVRLYLYPDFPDYRKETVILVFPDSSSISFKDLNSPSPTTANPERLESFRNLMHDVVRFVFIDCTWFQVNGMRKHAHFQSIPTLALDGRRTRFWRPQHNEPDGHLSTVEAVYYFCLDYDQWSRKEGGSDDYDGRYDNLLYFFEYFRRKVECEKHARAERRKRPIE